MKRFIGPLEHGSGAELRGAHAPKVSVVVPVYNTERYLRACLSSLVRQTMTDFEIVIVDDGSTDSSPLVIDEFARRYPDMLRIVNQKNQGSAAARNHGLEAATGEYVLFIDSDDWVSPDLLSTLVGAATAADADVVVCDYFIHWPRGGAQYASGVGLVTGDLRRDVIVGQLAQPWNKLIRRSILDDFDIEFPADVWGVDDVPTMLLVVLIAPKIIHVPEPLYHYRIARPGSVSNVSVTALGARIISRSVARLAEFTRDPRARQGFGEELAACAVAVCSMSLRYWRGQANEVTTCTKSLDSHFSGWRSNRYLPPLERLGFEWMEKGRTKQGAAALLLQLCLWPNGATLIAFRQARSAWSQRRFSRYLRAIFAVTLRYGAQLFTAPIRCFSLLRTRQRVQAMR